MAEWMDCVSGRRRLTRLTKGNMPRPSRLVQERRQKIIDSLLEVLTGDAITSAELDHFKATSCFFDSAKVLDKFLREFANHPDVQKEVAVSVVTHVLDRLMNGLPGNEPVPAAAADHSPQTQSN